jgi:N-acetylmuramic acid 6-phosphate etherase
MELATETRAEQFRDVETWPDTEILAAIAAGQRAAIDACAAAIVPIAAAARALTATWRSGGRIAYAGAGSSGLIAALDALEIPVTYGLEADRLPLLLAGGAASLEALDQESEDDTTTAIARVCAAGIGVGDMLIAVSASGATPFTLAAAAAAKSAGAQIVGIACNDPSPLLAIADLPIALPTGAEPVAGSTRMNAGTAQKCALNMLSTLTGIRLHHVHHGMMVNMRAENAKLRGRAARVIAEATGIDLAAAHLHLRASSFEVKPAILAASGATHPNDLLQSHDGNLRAALAQLRAGQSSGDSSVEGSTTSK